MAYPLELTDTHKKTYSDNVQMLAQQMQIPILNAVTRIEGTGEAHSISDLLAALEYQEEEQRARRNPENPSKASRRWVVYRPGIESGQYLDKEDKLKSAMDPTSKLMSNHMAAVRRGIHDRIVGIKKSNTGKFVVGERGIFGAATEGKDPTSAVSLPGAQSIAHGSARLTLTKLRTALTMLEVNDFGLEDDNQLYGLLSPYQKDDLIGVAVQAQGALNAFTIEQIKTGKPTSLLGINWIFSNRVPYTTSTSTIRQIPIFSKENIVAAFWQDIQGRIWNDTAAKMLPYMLVDANLDCTRIQDKGVVVIQCDESASP